MVIASVLHAATSVSDLSKFSQELNREISRIVWIFEARLAKVLGDLLAHLDE